jgi:hypothetical protein
MYAVFILTMFVCLPFIDAGCILLKNMFFIVLYVYLFILYTENIIYHNIGNN